MMCPEHNFSFVGLEDPQQWVIPSVVRWQSKHNPERAAIEFIDGESWTFSDCQQHAEHASMRLQAAGVGAGDHIAVLTDDAALFCHYWFGLSELGAVMVAINTGLRGEPLRHQLNIASVTLVLADQSTVGRLADVSGLPVLCFNPTCEERALPASGPGLSTKRYNGLHSDTACIMFTSGTSGPSKGVLMPQAHCLLFAKGTIDNLDLGPQDTFYICLPLFHANGLFMQLLACLACGARAVIRNRFSATQWLPDIRKHKATHTNMLGALAAFVTAQPQSGQDSDHCLRVVSAAPLPAVPERLLRERFGIDSIVPLYGMTEVNIPLYGDLYQSAPGTAGRLYARYFEVDIRDADTDNPLPRGTVGELMVRPKIPYGFMSGYVGMPDKTVEAWRNFWFHTGDAAYLREDGSFVFVDRIKDCIRRRGENISSYEVEQAFLACDLVTEAAAYAVPADGGQGMEDEVMVTLMVEPGISPDIGLLREQAAKNLAVFAVPRYLRTVTELPKTPTGKIRKVALRELGVTDDTWDAKA